MNTRLPVALSLFALLSASTSVAADEGFKYRKLKPADPPCLFLLDENTGQPTGDPVNPPCVLGSTTVNPGDDVNPELREKHGVVKEQESGLATGKRQPRPTAPKRPGT